jgi:hypothetical protein
MKLNITPRVRQDDPMLLRELREHARQVNDISEGRIVASYNALTTAPTAGDYAQGDYIRNSAPAELGSPGSKYIVRGFMCVSGGNPGTWVEDRGLTGN